MGLAVRLTGSSPRVQGTPTISSHRERLIRFIPACAGNTYSQTQQAVLPTVHPRVCREHPVDKAHPAMFPGSSPRVQGTLGHPNRSSAHGRFIPACAGNTRSHRTLKPRMPVHPRVCREHEGLRLAMRYPAGSSPRVQGTL